MSRLRGAAGGCWISDRSVDVLARPARHGDHIVRVYERVAVRS